MEWLNSVALALGASWVSGLRLYGCVTTLGLLGRFGYVKLPGEMQIMTHPWVIGVAGVLFVVEFVADKLPAVDSIWDAVHTFVRIPAGAVIAWSAFTQTDPAVQAVAVLLGGGLAFAAHGTKSVTRLAANTSPEPFSNIGLSLVEDGVAAGSTLALVFVPLLGIGLIIALLFVSYWLMKRLSSLARLLLKQNAGPSSEGPAE